MGPADAEECQERQERPGPHPPRLVYFHPQGASPERPSPWGAYLWQLLTSISAAGILGLSAWLFNVEARLAAIPNVQMDVSRLEGGREGNRAIIDRNSDRLTKIEAKLEQADEERVTQREVALNLGGDLRSLREAQQNLVVELTRLAETMRQLREDLSDVRNRPPPPERDQRPAGVAPPRRSGQLEMPLRSKLPFGLAASNG